nr:sigma-54 dependent transcriptional regulator [uncultured Holophaga sp.]
MPELAASWLGSWEAPWRPRGRRWGDAAWALGALSQAWLLGGREGRWPLARWQAGPRPGPWDGTWAQQPDPRWVALLRHGTPQADPARPRQREGELEAWCWAELLEGRSEAWWARAPLLLDPVECIRWLPWLGAIDPQGQLQVPPFVEHLLPEGVCRLPPGWWSRLLSGLDGKGRLLPSGSLPPGPPWELLLAEEGRLLEPFLLHPLPPVLEAYREAPWLQELPGDRWVIDPRLRAWGRGRGLPEPPGGLAFGAPTPPLIQAILRGQTPEHSWQRPIQADLAGTPAELPPPSGDPTLDRLRMRWGGTPAPASPGYPPWGCRAHPCSDPFHWMAEGRRAFLDRDLEGALRAFTLAHAHFHRLESPLWAGRAAANAGSTALFWGDLPALEAWQKAAGPQPEPFQTYDRALLKACRGDWKGASPLLECLREEHPDFEPIWVLRAHQGLWTGQTRLIEEALPRLSPSSFRCLLEAFLAGDFARGLPDLDAEEALQWAYLRLIRGYGSPAHFWALWEGCPSQLLRLELGLGLLQGRPEERSAGKLLKLQALADRSRSGIHLAKLKGLWPQAPTPTPLDPRDALETWLASRRHPTWICWEGGALGQGERPPEPLLARLLDPGASAPGMAGDRVWWSWPLHWDGSRVGTALVGLPQEGDPGGLRAVEISAPWVARLRPASPAPAPLTLRLLSDGSEPLATALRELARVAPSTLPVLIQGPSGSGKELAAWELHRLSQRRGPLVPVNCAAFAEGLLESELFGHVRGAFTGADRDRRGAIEQAEDGTLFLDEIADLSPRLQSLLLRVLQERELRRVGSERSRKVDVRFVAATHRDLEQLSAEGRFRSDLLFRLQGTVIPLPSLEARRHEFPFLVPHLVAQLAQEHGLPCPVLAPGLPRALASRPWPGNFRQLQHALARAILRCGQGPLQPEHFPELLEPLPERPGTWVSATQEFQRRLLLDRLLRNSFQVSETAEDLGLTRPALYAAARRTGLDLVAERIRWEGGDPLQEHPR